MAIDRARLREAGRDDGWSHKPVWGGLGRWFIAYLIMTVVVVATGLLIVDVFDRGKLGDLDRHVARWFADHRTRTLVNLATVGSGLAATRTLVPAIFIASVAFVVIWRRWNESLWLLTAIVLEKSVFLTTTYIVGRDRPLTQLGNAPPTSSYPSGHVSSAVVFYVVIAIVMSWHIRNAPTRALGWSIAVCAPIAVALSRILLGMHYLTDVVVGGALGGVSVTVAYFLTQRSIDDPQARTITHSVHASGGLDASAELQEPPAERDRAAQHA